MKIAVIPDCQVRDGVPTDHLTWAGKYLAEKQPDVIVCIGDFADMPSLSSYDKGKRSFEGRRYNKDIAAAKRGMELLVTPLFKVAKYSPRMVLTYGNHEDRITRAVNDDARLEGTLSLDDLGYTDVGWKVYPFLQGVKIGGVTFCHYMTSGVMGLPCKTPASIIAKHHMSCVVGHQQGKQIAYGRRGDGTAITAIIAGCPTLNHRVLKADLSYTPIGNILVGDELVSFDEHVFISKRRFKTGIVEAVKHDTELTYRVELKSGKYFDVTSSHQWLVKRGTGHVWVTTAQLRLGAKIPRFLDDKVLGQIRPQRLLNKFKPELLGCISSPDSYNDPVVGVYKLGVNDIARIQVSSGTYILDGYPHHNSFYQHNEEYLRPIENIHWRGMFFLHDVHDGEFDEMFLSMRYLKRRYK